MFRNTINRRATFSLVLFNIPYAVNTYNIAAVFSFIPVELGEGLTGLGLTIALYYIASGLFLIPGGIIAAKIGAKRTLVYGTLLYSAAAALTGFSDTLYQIVLLRFIVGVGMAFTLGPSYALLAKYFRKGSEGLAAGLRNAAFGIGGVIGLFIWAVLAEVLGWRVSLLLGGVIGLVSCLLLFLTVPADVHRAEFRLRVSDLRKLMLNRSLIVLGVILLGVNIGTGLYGYFIVFYIRNNLGINPGPAGFAGSLWLFFIPLTSPLAGKAYDTVRDVRKLILCSMMTLSVGVALPALGSISAAVLSAPFVGLSSGFSYTMLISLTRDLNEGHEEYQSIAVHWAHTLAFGGFWAPVLFSYLAITFGYGIGWLVGGFLTFVWVLPLLFMKIQT